MSEIIVFEYEDGALVVDSRIIAERLDIQHESFMRTINKYKKEAEQAFGALRFQIGAREDGNKGGVQPEWVLLNEEQATFYMTLSRNTPEVVQLKLDLVRKFSLAKKLLRQKGVVQQHSTVYIRRLENMSDHKVPDHLWTTFREGAEILLLVEKQYKVPVDEMDLCDGSIGHHWSQYRWTEESIGKGQLKDWAVESGQYIHKFRNNRGDLPCNAFQYAELPVFRGWLRNNYIPYHLPKYLVDKFGKRAVRQICEEQGKLNDYILEITNEKRTSVKQEEMYEVFLAAREAIANRYLLGE